MPHTPAPASVAGHYSPVVSHGGLLYVSGQLPITPGFPPQPALPFETQARIALDNLFAALAQAGARPGDLLKVTVYLVGAHRWDAFNHIYAERLGLARPARTVVPVPELHFGLLVELDAIAVLPARDAPPLSPLLHNVKETP